ncbi:Ig-like domain-containing protein [Candidatus Halobeggiatoa sp. HSG11]|nr:Ig-like domain-containing protein [Candidatus Halobeggiatoa sp. HSG11]
MYLKKLLFIQILVLLTSCIGGGGSGGSSSDNAEPVDIDRLTDEEIIIVKITSLHSSLPLHSKDISIDATVTDEQDNIVENGTVVNFATDLGIITESVLTDNGTAQAMFTPDMQAGLATITATVGNATDTLTITVKPADAGTIEISKVEPKAIGVVGSGSIQSSKVEFLIKDKLGNIVADKTVVKFALGNTTLGGGETITTQGFSGTEAEGTTNNGLVSVTLNSGTVAGNIDIIATIDDGVSTTARVIIVSSFPDADHLSLAAEFLNIAGGVKFGLQDDITAYVGDRFGNIVPDNTPVSFITEGGTIGKSVEGGAFTTTTELGQAVAILQSAGPTTPKLGGEMTLRKDGYYCDDDFDDNINYQYVSRTEPQNLCSNPGLVTVVAYTTGAESFIDVNGNGIFDDTDTHTDPGFIDSNNNNRWDMGEVITNKGDISEPYIDANDNRIFDLEEFYVDVNNNGEFDGPDGIFKDNTTIWRDIKILFSARPASTDTVPVAIKITPTTFSIPVRGSQKFLVENVGDIYGNALVKDSVFEVKTNTGRLGGNTNIKFDDGQKNTSFSFTLSNCSFIDDTCSEILRPATITIAIKSTNEGGQGSNGTIEIPISGFLNAEDKSDNVEDNINENDETEDEDNSEPIDVTTSEEKIVIKISSSQNSLSINTENIPIIATVKGEQGGTVENGTVVNFTTNLGIITESVVTNNGIAEATFTPNMQAGLATITATAGDITDTFTITVRPGQPGLIEISKVEPQVIGIINSGLVQSAKLEFLVKDKLGNIVADETLVKFSLGKTTLGGGETITTHGVVNDTIAEATTNNGLVSVTLNSGTVAGNVDVIATINEEISTVARVTVVSSFPDADHLSLAAEFLNIAGGVTFGLQDDITAFVGDRFGNIVPDGTTVSFITEGGTIGKSVGGGAFTTTTEFGQATAVLQSAGPTTPHLGGEMTLRTAGFYCEDDFDNYTNYLYVSGTEPQNLCSNPGLVTLVAYTTGTESFIDVNGNGIFDVTGEEFEDTNNNGIFDVSESFIDSNGNSHFDGADTHTDSGFIDLNNNNKWDMGEIITNKGDMSEPYIDANDNQIFDLAELYVDVNGDGRFNGPDGIFQDNTTIWEDIKILFSGHTALHRSTPIAIEITPLNFAISDGGSETFIVKNVGDIYGNALVQDTTITVTTNNGVLGGSIDMLLGDGRDNTSFGFSLSSNPCEISVDEETKEKTVICPEPEAATVTVHINPPDGKKQGGNTGIEFSVSGTINVK